MHTHTFFFFFTAGDFRLTLATSDEMAGPGFTGTGSVAGFEGSGGVNAVVVLDRLDGGGINLARPINVLLGLMEGTAGK